MPIQELTTMIEEAFRPLTCVAEVHYDREVVFRIYDDRSRCLFTQRLTVTPQFRADSEFLHLICGIREHLEQQGHKLNSWTGRLAASSQEPSQRITDK